jgi:hypothetical protein
MTTCLRLSKSVNGNSIWRFCAQALAEGMEVSATSGNARTAARVRKTAAVAIPATTTPNKIKASHFLFVRK